MQNEVQAETLLKKFNNMKYKYQSLLIKDSMVSYFNFHVTYTNQDLGSFNMVYINLLIKKTKNIYSKAEVHCNLTFVYRFISYNV